MSVYVGIDVHRKRSQVAVVNEGGEVLANRIDDRHLRALAMHVDSDVNRHRGPPSRARVSPGT